MYPNADYDNVVINGDWPGSGPWYGWGVTLTDDDADGVYTGSLTLDPATSFEFVVAVTGAGDGWSGWGVQFGQPGCDGSNFTATTGDGGTSSDLEKNFIFLKFLNANLPKDRGENVYIANCVYRMRRHATINATTASKYNLKDQH